MKYLHIGVDDDGDPMPHDWYEFGTGWILDALETERFWAQAERAKSWWDAHPDEREAIEHEVAERDAAVNRIR